MPIANDVSSNDLVRAGHAGEGEVKTATTTPFLTHSFS